MPRTLIITLAMVALMTAEVEAAKLSKEEQKLIQYVDAHLEDAIALLEETVNIPSATTNLEGVRKVGRVFARELEELGFDTEWIEMPKEMNRAGHLFAERNGSRGERLLLIGHLDTVLEGPPFRREGNIGYGIGASDMKGGDVVIVQALRALRSIGALDGRRILIALTGDEESTGSPLEIARHEFIEAGKRSDAALAFESAVENTATIARRGVTTWRLDVTAATGHSSDVFSERLGYGAIFETGRILDEFRKTLQGEQYVTFNPSIIVAGTTAQLDREEKTGSASGKTNVVAKEAHVEGDLRFISNEQRESVKARMEAIVSKHLSGTDASIAFADKYPAMAPTEANRSLLNLLDQVSRDLRFGEVPALDPARRGAGDVSFVAPHVASLDGLGAKGEREHTSEEFVYLDAFPMLIKRTAILLYRMTR